MVTTFAPVSSIHFRPNPSVGTSDVGPYAGDDGDDLTTTSAVRPERIASTIRQPLSRAAQLLEDEFENVQPRLQAFVLRRGVRGEAVEDVVQEALARFLKRGDKDCPEPKTLFAVLSWQARAAIKALRTKRWPERSIEDRASRDNEDATFEVVGEREQDPLVELIEREDRRSLAKTLKLALENLPANQRAIVLAWLAGESLAVTFAMVKPNTLAQWKRRALLKLTPRLLNHSPSAA